MAVVSDEMAADGIYLRTGLPRQIQTLPSPGPRCAHAWPGHMSGTYSNYSRNRFASKRHRQHTLLLLISTAMQSQKLWHRNVYIIIVISAPPPSLTS